MRKVKRLLTALWWISILHTVTFLVAYTLLFLAVWYYPEYVTERVQVFKRLPTTLQEQYTVHPDYAVWLRIFLAGGTLAILTLSLAVRLAFVLLLASWMDDVGIFFRWFLFYLAAVFLGYVGLIYTAGTSWGPAAIESVAGYIEYVPEWIVAAVDTVGAPFGLAVPAHAQLFMEVTVTAHTLVVVMAILLARLFVAVFTAPFMPRRETNPAAECC